MPGAKVSRNQRRREAGAVGDAHDVPEAGGGVAEGVEAAEGVHGGRVGGGEDDAAGADGGGDGAGLDDAHADGAGTLIAGAGGYGSACGEAGGGGSGGADAGADFGAFEEAGEPGHGDAGGFGDFGGPAAVGDVEQQGAGGLLHVDGELAGEAEADVVLGAEDVGDAGEDFRLVVAHPEELGEGEVGQGGIAGELDEAGRGRFCASSQSHSGWVRWSHQMSAGRRTAPSASSMTQPCIWPVRPMASISAGRRCLRRRLRL